MENLNKHRLVLVKYIKRQRNLSKKVKKKTPNSTYNTGKKNDINKKQNKNFVPKKVKNIVVNGHNPISFTHS